MSRLRVQEALAERVEDVRERLLAAYGRFRESRLYVQTVCTAVLVGAVWLVHLLPYGPLSRADAALVWTVTQDYDFRGMARQVSDWAKARGGWRPAVAGLWQQGVGQVRDWVGPVGPFAERQAASGAADQAATPPGSAVAPPAAILQSDSESGQQAEAGTPEPSIPQKPLQPVEGSVLYEFGWLPQSVGEEFHEGIDFLADAGAPVVAILDGTVQAIRQDNRLGTVVEVKHVDVIAMYAQVEGVAVRAGDEVSRGQKIATVAPARGLEQKMPAHLHFEIRPVSTGQPVNPAPHLGLGGRKL